MGINRLGQKNTVIPATVDSDEDMIPLVREYGKDHPEIYSEAHDIISGRISKTGQWCLLSTKNYILLMKSSASAVQQLYNEILPALNGKRANRLVCEPVKKDRYGGCIGVDDESQGYYSFDEKTLEFEITEEKPEEAGKKQKKLSIEMFLDTNSVQTTGLQTQESTENDKYSTASNTSTKRKNTSNVALA